MIISQPKVTVNKLPAAIPQGFGPQKILVVGQMLSTGGAVASVLREGVQSADVKSLFGDGSYLQNALNAMFDAFDRSGSLVLPQIDVIPLADAGGGVAATGTIVIAEVGGSTNAATVSGTLLFTIGSQEEYQIALPITKGDSISGIATALAAAINAVTALPVTAANSSGTITLTCRHKGTIGNAINLKVDGVLKSGANYVIGNVGFTLTAFASGATDPTLPVLATVVGSNRYQTVVHPVQYGTTFSVANFLDSRFNVDNNILDGVAVVKKDDTLANHLTAIAALNSQSLVYICDKTVADAMWKGSSIVEFDFVISARVAAIRALRLTSGSNLSRLSLASAQGALDASGGAHIASLPYFNTPLYGVSPIVAGKGFSQTEIESLVVVGGSVVGNNVAGNVIILGEIATTYKTNSGGNADLTWHFLETVDTMSAAAEYIFNNLKSDFAQSRMTGGNLVAGFNMVNVEAMRGQMKKYYVDLSDLALVPAGNDPVQFFLDNLSVVFDLINGKATVGSNLAIVVQLREILVNLKTTFSTN